MAVQARLPADAWWERIQSESSQSYGASHVGMSGPWIQKHGFEIARSEIPPRPWSVEVAERTGRIKEVLSTGNAGGGWGIEKRCKTCWVRSPNMK